MVVFDLTRGEGNIIDYESTLQGFDTNLSVIKMNIKASHKKTTHGHAKVDYLDIVGQGMVQQEDFSAYVDKIIKEKNSSDDLGEPPEGAMQSETIKKIKFTEPIELTKPTEPVPPQRSKRLPQVEAAARRLSRLPQTPVSYTHLTLPTKA